MITAFGFQLVEYLSAKRWMRGATRKDLSDPIADRGLDGGSCNAVHGVVVVEDVLHARRRKCSD